jgi:hypothetical protein
VQKHTRREVLAGGAAALAVATPTAAAPAITSPAALWPTETQLQRGALIVRTMIEHIAETQGRPAHTVTLADIYDCVRYFDMTLEETIAAVRECLERLRLTGEHL